MVVKRKDPRRCRPARRAHACFRGDVREGSIAVVAVQDIVSVIGHIQIGEAIGVVVTGSYSHAVVVAGLRQPRGLGDVCESAVTILTVQAVAKRTGPGGQKSPGAPPP